MKYNLRYIALLGQVGIIIMSNVLITIVIYKLIEKFLFKSSILFIILIIIGVLSGFYSVYKIITKGNDGGFNE